MLLICSLYSFKTLRFDEVKGWYLAGSNPKNYEIGTENSTERSGKVAYLKSVKNGTGFGTIMQTFIPTNYLGKRVRLTGYIKSSKVNGWAGMWFRIDGENNKMLGFDNMQNRAIKGETAWTQYSIVLDVPQESKNIAYGVLLAGQGNIWIDNLEFEVVDKSVPTNGTSTTPTEPVNTNFEEN
jgi:hypothetical protein